MVSSARSMQELPRSTNQLRPKQTIFNGEYEVLKTLGEGNTSKVYFIREIEGG